LSGLLVRAKRPLIEAFGEQAIKQLALVSDEEGFETLFCSVLVSRDMQQARQALRRFDEAWWLDNVKDAAGRLNFDFQMT
jgi:AraC-like DNA-binding protein